MEYSVLWRNALCFMILFYCVNARPKLFYLQKFANTISRLSKRNIRSLERVCPVVTERNTKQGKKEECGVEHSSCNSDKDCRENSVCCYDGCIHFCHYPGIKEWVPTSTSKPISHMPKSSYKNDKTNHVQQCSTSNLIAWQPRLCPPRYICDIRKEEDRAANIPNSGICIIDLIFDEFQPEVYKPIHSCIYKGVGYDNNESFRKDCSACTCLNTVINCEIDVHCVERSRNLLGDSVERTEAKS